MVVYTAGRRYCWLIKNQGREEVNRIYNGIRARDSAQSVMGRPKRVTEIARYIPIVRNSASPMP